VAAFVSRFLGDEAIFFTEKPMEGLCGVGLTRIVLAAHCSGIDLSQG
jgi:hypothetical protein